MIRSRGVWWWVSVGIKLALLVLLSLAVLFPHWPQFEGKAIGARLVMYPAAALIVPACWLVWSRLFGRTRGVGYPYATDILVTLPFAVDTLGNALNLYDTIEWWDDFMHFFNWALLMAGIGALIARSQLPRWAIVLMVTGIGSTLAIGWEIAEYYSFIRNSPELATAYTDTLGDLALGTLGGFLAALGVAFGLRRPDAARPAPVGAGPRSAQ